MGQLITMDAIGDQGHRYGNFPNYYAFHPPDNRLRVLERANISSYIRDGLSFCWSNDGLEVEGGGESVVGHGADSPASSASAASKSSGGGDYDAADDAAFESARKRSRHHPEGRGLPAARSRTGRKNVIYYCDLGCNAGELTMAMANSLVEKCAGGMTSDDAKLSNHPADDEYKGNIGVQCLGLDLDPILIERAVAKFSTNPPPPPSCVDYEKSISESTKGSHSVSTMAVFDVCDLCSESEHNDACSSFFGKEILASENDDEGRSVGRPRPLFHLTTIFSMTMWIHVHGGDDGLREFLKRACGWTRRFLLLEPQPSGCYRKANTRLRKMGRPELDDVTSLRLKMREDVENEIESIVIRCGFRRVVPSLGTNGMKRANDSEAHVAVTSWNRSLHLYERLVR